MDDMDLARLIAARADLPNLLVTVAPETVTPEQIGKLAGAGIVVSIGHSDAGIQTASAAFEAGASMATHLFNAMSQLGNREPGVVGAVLNHGSVHAGLIADGIHVHKAAIEIALRAKTGPGRIFLVTDAMSQTGTDIETLTLNGRTITRVDGALRLADGTLAGADLDMIDAVEFMHSQIGLPLDEAIRMASLYPAEAMGIEAEFGHLQPGAIASFVHLSNNRQMRATWINGAEVWRA
jgi:N-acetylglucosamine-6-phosphate deacetylase